MLLLYNQSVITVMRANSCFFFFCLLCCSVQKTGQSFTASSFLTLTQLGEQRKEKTVSSSHIHTGNSSLCFLYVNDLYVKSWWLKDCCPLCPVNWLSLSRPTKLLQKGVYSFNHCIFARCSSEQFILFFYEHYIYIGSFTRVLKSRCTRLCSRALFIHSLCNFFISAFWFFFLSGPSTVLEERACTLQHSDVHFN